MCMNQRESGIFLVKVCEAKTNLFDPYLFTPWLDVYLDFISDLHGSMSTFFACTESNEYSNRRADKQALLRSRVMHNESALKFVLRDKNYGEKYLPDFFFTLNFDASQCQFWQISAAGFQKAKTKSLWNESKDVWPTDIFQFLL